MAEEVDAWCPACGQYVEVWSCSVVCEPCGIEYSDSVVCDVYSRRFGPDRVIDRVPLPPPAEPWKFKSAGTPCWCGCAESRHGPGGCFGCYACTGYRELVAARVQPEGHPGPKVSKAAIRWREKQARKS